MQKFTEQEVRFCQGKAGPLCPLPQCPASLLLALSVLFLHSYVSLRPTLPDLYYFRNCTFSYCESCNFFTLWLIAVSIYTKHALTLHNLFLHPQEARFNHIRPLPVPVALSCIWVCPHIRGYSLKTQLFFYQVWPFVHMETNFL